MTTIRAVLFDFGGVYTASPFGALDAIGAQSGADPTVLLETVFGPYHEDTDHPWHRLERGEVDLMTARDEIVALGRERGVDADPFQMLAALGGSGGARAAVVDATRRVRARGHRTALVTNNAKEFREGWRRLVPVDELFDVVVDSSEIGIRKPDRRIFELTLERLSGVEFAGNVAAAEALGLHGILVEDDPTAALAALEELLVGRRR